MKIRSLTIVPATALLMSCSQSFPDIPSKRTSITPFIARGHTPAWQLKLEEKSMRFRANYGQVDIDVPVPNARPTNRGNRYETARLIVDITFTTCADRMSLDRYSEVVTITADGEKYSGCGGMKLQSGSLNGTNWTVISMNQIAILSDVETHVRFDNGYASIKSICGKVGGDFAQVGNVVTFRQMNIPPKRVCSTQQAAHEAKVAAFLRGELTVRYSTEGNLILEEEAGNQAILKRLL